MRFTKAKALVVSLMLVLALSAACGGDDDGGAEVEVAEQPESRQARRWQSSARRAR